MLSPSLCNSLCQRHRMLAALQSITTGRPLASFWLHLEGKAAELCPEEESNLHVDIRFEPPLELLPAVPSGTSLSWFHGYRTPCTAPVHCKVVVVSVMNFRMSVHARQIGHSNVKSISLDSQYSNNA